MKSTRIMYWILTGLLAAGMVLGAIPDVISHPEAVKMIHDILHYPVYFVPFTGVAKLLGVIAILVPGFPRLKEWAYAGFTFDLTGAIYSSIAVGEPAARWAIIFIGYILVFGSYYFYHRKRNAA